MSIVQNHGITTVDCTLCPTTIEGKNIGISEIADLLNNGGWDCVKVDDYSNISWTTTCDSCIDKLEELDDRDLDDHEIRMISRRKGRMHGIQR